MFAIIGNLGRKKEQESTMRQGNGINRDDKRIKLNVWSRHKKEVREALDKIKRDNHDYSNNLEDFCDDAKEARAEFAREEIALVKYQDLCSILSIYEGSVYSFINDEIMPLNNHIDKKIKAMADYLIRKGNNLTALVERYVADGKNDAPTRKGDIAAVAKKNRSKTNINDSARDLYLVLDAIGSTELRGKIESKIQADSRANFAVRYGKAVHSLESYKDSELEERYLDASSPIEAHNLLRALSSELIKTKSRDIWAVNNRIDGIKDIKKPKIWKVFADANLSPELNNLYNEMEKVASSGMAYFNHRRKLREGIEELCRYKSVADSLVRRIDADTKDDGQVDRRGIYEKRFSKKDIGIINTIKNYASYLEQHPELKGMAFVKVEAERYSGLYSDLTKAVDYLLSNEAKVYDKTSGEIDGKTIIEDTRTVIVDTEQLYGGKDVVYDVQKGIADSNHTGIKEGNQTKVRDSRETNVGYGEQTGNGYQTETRDGVQPKTEYENPVGMEYNNQPEKIDRTLSDITRPDDKKLREAYNIMCRIDDNGETLFIHPISAVKRLDAFVFPSISNEKNDRKFVEDVVDYLNNPANRFYNLYQGGESIRAELGNFLEQAEATLTMLH
ncbi:MAG: hypothetical protein ABIG89_02790 [Candidatus Woesearchaeota archaeon]